MSDDKPKDKCGVFGYYGHNHASEKAYLALHNLQHRGQESCGICSWDGNNFQLKKGMGIVNDVFTKESLDILDGYAAIGHVRYSTIGCSKIQNAQPFLIDSCFGQICIAHNGEVSNHRELRDMLLKQGDTFQMDSDTEVILKLICKQQGSFEERIVDAFKLIKPSYSIVLMGNEKLVGIRDPAGVRPLELGKTKTGYVLASESVAFDIIGAEYIREVKPGEMIVIDKDGLKSYRLFDNFKESRCIFEQIYFSRPDSLWEDGVSIGIVRREFGRQLFRENSIEADIVIAVPDSSFDAAIGVSLESGIRYDQGLIRSHYIGRSFIEPSQELRDAAVLKKFNVNEAVVKGKKIIVVDDSLVRGTTMKNLIRLIRQKGAKEIHVMISSPPYRNSCFLGVDTADESKLVARYKNISDIKEQIGADSLYYLSQEGMLSNPYLKGRGFCNYCFDGVEPAFLETLEGSAPVQTINKR